MGTFLPLQHIFQNESVFDGRMIEGGRRWMNRPQYSIVRILQFAIEKKNLIIFFSSPEPKAHKGSL